MAEKSTIEWTEATWNPITGCTMVSAGCTNCYAMGLAGTRMKSHPSREGLTRVSGGRHVWTGEVRLNEDWLDDPLRWKRPRHVFVCAHGDLFHESVPDEWIDRVFRVMAMATRHTFQVLTKRPQRAEAYLRKLTEQPGEWRTKRFDHQPEKWPLPNVWLGTSIEDQATADERIPHLLATLAAVRFISAEPLLGPVDLLKCPTHGDAGGAWDWLRGTRQWHSGQDVTPRLDWVIVGGESGRDARPMHPDWARSLRDQCQAAGVPFFFKQWGEFAVSKMDEDGRFDPPLPARGIDKVQTWDGSFWRSPREGETVQEFMRASKAWAVPIGKKASGRLLDGREWSQMPGSAPA